MLLLLLQFGMDVLLFSLETGLFYLVDLLFVVGQNVREETLPARRPRSGLHGVQDRFGHLLLNPIVVDQCLGI